MTTAPTIPTLYLDRDAEQEWLSAVEVGTVVDGVRGDRFVEVGEHFAWVLDQRRERTIGFALKDTAADFSPDGDDYAELWAADGPRFHAPSLALTSALAGEIIVAALARYATTSTLNRAFFIQALGADDEAALKLWQLCLDCGDLSAHYGLGYTYYDLDRNAEAYTHLRYYAQIAVEQPWAWTWLGHAALAIGEQHEAIDAWRRASELDEGDETGARELLQAQLRKARRS